MIFQSSATDAIKQRMRPLTKIHGVPDFMSLTQMRKEVRANVSAIHSSIGGGANGHLWLVETPAAFARISATPAVIPVHPGNLPVVPPGTTSHLAANIRDTHAFRLQQFNVADTVSKVTGAQIINALDEEFIAAEINQYSGQLQNDIPTTFANLFAEYGHVTPTFLDEKITELKNKAYDPAIPLANTYKAIDDIVELGDAANLPLTTAQQVVIVLEILKKTGRFSKYIATWNALPTADKTWPRMKTHFNTARREMKESGALDIVQEHHFQANQATIQELAQGVAQALQLQALANHAYGGLGGYPPYNQVPPEDENQGPPSMTPSSDEEDSGTADSLAALYSKMPKENNNDHLFKQFEQHMKTMTQKIDTLQSQLNERNTGRSNNNGNRRTLITNKKGHHKYCWSHGLCNHKGSECTNRREGHKVEATLFNRFNGSEKNVPNYLCNK